MFTQSRDTALAPAPGSLSRSRVNTPFIRLYIDLEYPISIRHRRFLAQRWVQLYGYSLCGASTARVRLEARARATATTCANAAVSVVVTCITGQGQSFSLTVQPASACDIYTQKTRNPSDERAPPHTSRGARTI